MDVVCPGGTFGKREVWEGVAALEAGRYLEASDKFDVALSHQLHEVPNFQLLGGLAKAYWKGGEPDRARNALAQAEGAL